VRIRNFCRASLVALLLFACGRDANPALTADSSPLEHPDFKWAHGKGEGYELYWERHLSPGPTFHLFRRLLPAARSNALRLIGEPDTAPPLNVLLVGSRAAMKTLTGREANGMALPRHHAIVLVFRGSPNTLAIRHETMHVLTHALWPGDGNNPWVREGLGVLAGGQCSGFTPRQVAAHLAAVGRLPLLSDVQTRFWQLDELPAHLSSASFMQFLYETHGSEALRAIWVRGMAGLADHLGQPRDTIETRWYEYLNAVPMQERPADWSRFASGCRWDPDALSDAA